VNEPESTTITRFLKYASSQLKPLGVRVSADVFGLAATNNLGIGQSPRKIARVVDALSPMVYPSHFGPGNTGWPTRRLLRDDGQLRVERLRHAIRGSKAELVPWIQDFTMGRKFTLADIRDEILAVRRSGARGYLIWNASGEYTRAHSAAVR